MSSLQDILLDLQLITVHYAPDSDDNTLKALQLNALADIKKLVEDTLEDRKTDIEKTREVYEKKGKTFDEAYHLDMNDQIDDIKLALNKLIEGDKK